MKAKIYPLTNMPSVATTYASPFSTQLEIVLASLAKGTTTIKSIANNTNINTTIKWCELMGASIKRNEDSFIIRGVDQKISFKDSPLFEAEDSLSTAMLMLPIFCTISQPFGMNASPKVLEELTTTEPIFKKLGVEIYKEFGMVRYEKKLVSSDIEISGDMDINFVTGLIISQTMLDGTSNIRLRAPVRFERTYSLVLKILRKFKIDVKHPNSMRYEVNGNQHIKACTISTEMDNRMLAYTFLLARKIDEKEKGIRIRNYNFKNRNMDDYQLLEFVRNNAIVARQKGFKRVYGAKEIVESDAYVTSENRMSFLMMVGSLCKNKLTMYQLHLENKRQKEQFNLALEAFKKLGVTYQEFADGIIINGHRIEEKVQVDSYGNPFIAMDLCILALLSDAPITVKQVECIDRYSLDFFDILKDYGAHIEFIHD